LRSRFDDDGSGVRERNDNALLLRQLASLQRHWIQRVLEKDTILIQLSRRSLNFFRRHGLEERLRSIELQIMRGETWIASLESRIEQRESAADSMSNERKGGPPC